MVIHNSVFSQEIRWFGVDRWQLILGGVMLLTYIPCGQACKECFSRFD